MRKKFDLNLLSFRLCCRIRISIRFHFRFHFFFRFGIRFVSIVLPRMSIANFPKNGDEKSTRILIVRQNAETENSLTQKSSKVKKRE